MSNTKHTPGPLRIGERDTFHKQPYIPITYDFGMLRDVAFCWALGPEATKHAARIVACVNACEGMDDPAKEIAAMRDALRAIEAHHIELNQQKGRAIERSHTIALARALVLVHS